MKRFVDVRKQGVGGKFSFYCTSIDRYLTFNGNQVWNSKSNFREDYEYYLKEFQTKSDLNRYLSIMPDWVEEVHDYDEREDSDDF